MCPCIKFQSIWRTLGFGTKFAQSYMKDEILKKINIKIEISIYQSVFVPNVSQFEELQILGPHLPKKYV